MRGGAGSEKAPLPSPAVWGLRRALLRRHRCMVEAHRAECRLWSLAMWAFPDVWRACGGHQLAQPVLGRWTQLAALARAHLDSIAEIVAGHSRDRDPPGGPSVSATRPEAGCGSGRAGSTSTCWPGRWASSSTTSTSPTAASARDGESVTIWAGSWPDDLLTTVPGIGPICAAATRAWWADAELSSAKQAAAFIGLNPSNWESGLSASPSRPITKEGPPALRLAYYQAANVARRHDPGLAAHYRKLMVERHHNHIKANTAVARKLACRAWAVLDSGQPYQLRDLDGSPIDADQANAICATLAVPNDVRQRTRAHQQHGRQPQLSQEQPLWSPAGPGGSVGVPRLGGLQRIPRWRGTQAVPTDPPGGRPGPSSARNPSPKRHS